MPLTLGETIAGHHRGLLRALEKIEALVGTPGTDHDLAAAIETVRRKLLAHELTAERFVVGPLRRLHLLDERELGTLADERDQLSQDAVRLTSRRLDAGSVDAFVRGVRHHIEGRIRAVGPAARSAALEGRLPAVPLWYVEEVYGQHGDAGAHCPEEWLG